MINVVWSCLEVNVMNNGDYVEGALTFTHTHYECMIEVNECKLGIVG